MAQTTNGNLTDNATNGLANFTISPTPIYSVITNPPTGSGKCFHLCHTNPVSQYLQLNEVLLPATNTTFSFKSCWVMQRPTNPRTCRLPRTAERTGRTFSSRSATTGKLETVFTNRSLSLSNFVGQLTLLRFNYAFTSGSYYTGNDPYYWLVP